MSEEQKIWLNQHPNYSPVRYTIVSLRGWANQGWLYASGRFVEDDGKTLFASTKDAIRVGRHYDVV